jgi:hypothetical protein
MQERRKIENWWHAKVPVIEMARVLKRHKSTIFREIKRNFWADDAFPKKYAGYFGMAAHQRTQRRRSTQRKLLRYPELCQHIVARLKNGWTPEQISNRMIYEGDKQRVCHALPDRVSRSDVPRGKRFIATSIPKKACATSFGGTCPCTERTGHPAVHANVKSPSLTVMSASCSGHPLGTLLRNTLSGNGRCRSPPSVWSLGRRLNVVRTEAWANECNVSCWTGQPVHGDPQEPEQADETCDGQDHALPGRVSRSDVPKRKAIKDLPFVARRSITFDRGTEFVSWPHLQAGLGTQTWFCDPSSPWQKGTVENTNRRARRWLPRKRDIRAMTDNDIKQICD